MAKAKVDTGSIRNWERDVDEIKSDINILFSSKVDEKVMNLKFEGAEKMHEASIDRITEGLEGVKSDVRGLYAKMSRRSSVQLGGIVALVVAILGGAVFTIKMTSQVEKNTESVEGFKGDLQETVQAIELKDEKDKELRKGDEKQRLVELRRTLRSVLAETDIDKKPTRKKR